MCSAKYFSQFDAQVPTTNLLIDLYKNATVTVSSLGKKPAISEASFGQRPLISKRRQLIRGCHFYIYNEQLMSWFRIYKRHR